MKFQQQNRISILLIIFLMLSINLVRAQDAGWRDYISLENTLQFRYPADWIVAAANSTGVRLSIPESDSGLIIGIITEENLESQTDFDAIALEVGTSFTGDDNTPVMREVEGRTVARFMIEEASEVGIVDIIDYPDLDDPVVVVIVLAGMPSQQDYLISVIDTITASLQYPVSMVMEQQPLPEIILEDIPDWYYALDDTGTLISYQLDGETFELLSGLTDIDILADLGGNRILIQQDAEDAKHLYLVNPDLAQLIDTLPDYNLFREALVQNDDYIVLATYFQPLTTGLLNIETGDFSPLIGSHSINDCCAFSEDGQYLYYASTENTPDDSDIIWALHERDLQSGEDQILFTFDEFQGEWFAIIVPDANGEYWLTHLRDRETRTINTRLHHLDGSNNILGEEFDETIIGWYWMDDVLVRIQLDDAENHQLTVFDTSENELMVYPTVPDIFPFRILGQYTDDRILLVGVDNDLYVVSPDQAPTLLGFAPFLLNNGISPDGRWTVLGDWEDDPENGFIYNLENQQFLHLFSFFEYGPLMSAGYFDNGHILQFREDVALLIYHDTGHVISLPLADERDYFELLSDGSVLYTQSEGTAAIGIYRMNPTNDETEQILSGIYEPIQPAGR